MKYLQIIEIRDALVELGKERLPIAFEIAKNIRICNGIINETASLSKEIFEQYADKDEGGMPRMYPTNTEGQTVMRITDPALLAHYQEELGKILSEEHILSFVKISGEKIRNEKLNAATIVPLIDVIVE